MTPGSTDLGRRLAALRGRLSEVGATAARAAAALAAGTPADRSLLDALRSTSTEVAAVREALLLHAAAAGIAPAARPATAADLESLLARIVELEHRREREVTWSATRASALDALRRVEALVHSEDPTFAPLAACKARAREIVASLPADPAEAEAEAQRIAQLTRPFIDLVQLAESWNALDDAQAAALQDIIAQEFGAPVALAALRGKLGGAQPRGAAVARAVAAPSAAVSPVMPAVSLPPAPAAAAVAMPPAAAAPPPAPPDVTSPIPRPTMPPPLELPAAPLGLPTPDVPPIGGRLTLEAAAAEDPAAQQARQASLERLARQSARWWIDAWTAWKAMRDKRLGFEAAVPKLLARFPHLLSVPIQRSDERGSGGVAEGYALLLEHVEKQESGSVASALRRLDPQLAQDQGIATELYAYLVAEGRLYKTYPDFVKTVLASALPSPGVWTQGSIIERADRTTVVTRPDDPPGGDARESRDLTDASSRAATQRFTAMLAPLTSRVFTLEAEPVGAAIEAEIKLTQNDSASDHAWIVTAPGDGGSPGAPRRHKTGGTSVSLGTEVGTAWIAVFNPDPHGEKRYEVAVTLKRKAGSLLGARPPAPKSSPPAGKKRRWF